MIWIYLFKLFLLCLTISFFLSLFVSSKPQQSASGNNESSQVGSTKEGNPSTIACDSQDEGRTCSMTRKESPPSNATAETEPIPQKLQMPPCSECEMKKAPEKPLTSFEGMAAREEKIL
nr:leucine zipper protein 2-like [Chlorocebus sabaeus]